MSLNLQYTFTSTSNIFGEFDIRYSKESCLFIIDKQNNKQFVPMSLLHRFPLLHSASWCLPGWCCFFLYFSHSVSGSFQFQVFRIQRTKKRHWRRRLEVSVSLAIGMDSIRLVRMLKISRIWRRMLHWVHNLWFLTNTDWGCQKVASLCWCSLSLLGHSQWGSCL